MTTKPKQYVVFFFCLGAFLLQACASSSESGHDVRFHFLADNVDKPFQSIDTIRSGVLLGQVNGKLDSIELSSVNRIVLTGESSTGTGLLVGFFAGYSLGYLLSDDPPKAEGLAAIVPQWTRGEIAFLAAVGGGLLGALVGAAAGADVVHEISGFRIETKIALVQSLIRQQLERQQRK
jgi:hypothetical protein